jgi:5-methyltetrahydropteroyltriglutamate--homocysteine methyltransferase
VHRSTNRILTTHVGSLVRPPRLRDFLKSRHEGKHPEDDAYRRCLHDSVTEIVQRQAAVGLDIINDGEFGKTISWSRYVLERMTGFEKRDAGGDSRAMPASTMGKDRRDFPDFYREYDPSQGFTDLTGWAVMGPITYKGQAQIKRDIKNLKDAVAGVHTEEVFMAAVAPSSVAPERKDMYYKSDEEYLYAVADALREEYQAIVDSGLILQIDDAYLALMYDTIVPPGTLEDYRRWAALRVEVLNHALRGISADRTRYHVCWGSWNAPHVSDVPLRDIIDLILNVRVGAYSLEMANPRHEHEWRIFESTKIPDDRVLLPGVISHSTNVVEHPELVAERLTRLANLVGRENVIASTDCGFAQGPFVQRVHPSIMWAKLESLVEGARLASRVLWG